MHSSLTLVLFLLTAWGIMFFVHWVVYVPIARVFEVSLPYWYLVLGFLAFMYLLASVGVRTMESIITDRFYFVAAAWLGVVFILFSVSLVYELVHFVTGFDSRLILGTLLLIGLGFSVIALMQGQQLTVRKYTVPIANLEKSIRIVHLSDIHVGTVHQTQYLERIVRETNALTPDIVLVTGDLFDGSAPIDEDILTPLNKLTAPSFFSNGNHEEYEGLARVIPPLTNLADLFQYPPVPQ